MDRASRSRSVSGRLSILKDCPRELWLIFLVKYVESCAYYILSYTLIFYLDEFGFTEEESRWAFSVYVILISVYGFVMGTVIDQLGVKWSLVGGMTILFASRLALVMATEPQTVLLILFTFLPLGASIIPVMQIGVKRYSYEINRTISFSIFYVMMNLAALTASPVVDIIHREFHDSVSFNAFGHTYSVSTNRSLILLCAIPSFVNFLIALIAIRESSEELTVASYEERPVLRGSQILLDVLRSAHFWRFFLLVVLLMGVRVLYRHLDVTFPLYMMREMGPTAMYASVIGINPLCICVAVPVIIPLSIKVPPLKIILAGSLVSALSPFCLTVGHSYTNCIFFVTVLSLGEAAWAPRLFEYAVMSAEPGKEGTFLALSSAPTFVATLLTGGVSSWMLDTFCPENGPTHSSLMWAFIGVTSILSPILLYAFYDIVEQDPVVWMQKKDNEFPHNAYTCEERIHLDENRIHFDIETEPLKGRYSRHWD